MAITPMARERTLVPPGIVAPMGSLSGDNGPMDRAIENPVSRSITLGSDFLQLRIDDAPAAGLSDWLTQRLRLAISDGRLQIGSKLPATRVLAAELRVSRGVVTEAYQRLTEDGLVAGRGRGGTIVVAAPAGPPARAMAGTPAPPAPLAPAPSPRSAWLRAERSVLNDIAPADLGYGDPRGAPALRHAVASWLARTRGIRADPAEVIIVAGVAQGLGLLARVLRDDGICAVAVEDPGSLGARQHLRNLQLDTPPVPVDSGGLRIDELRASGAAAVLLTPAHQFPTGVVLDGERRYDRPPVPALRSMLAERICYTGSVSKLLAPALRVGWLLPPPKYREALVAAKRTADLGNAVLPQLVLAQLVESGQLERQLRLLRRRHRRRRDAMIEAIGAHLPGAVVHGAAAGLHLMITFAGGFADAELAAAALARGVKVQPLSWHSQRPCQPGLVLGYAANSPADIGDGIAILGEVLRRLVPGPRRGTATG